LNSSADTQATYTSLVTLVREETPEMPPESDAWPTPPSDAPAGARIVMLRPDGTTEAVSLATETTISIGREPDNDLVLPSSSTSRHHARVTIERGRARLTDLNSTNGTYLDGERLLPGVTERWTPGQQVRIGDYWLSLELSVAGTGRRIRPSAGPTRAETSLPHSPGVEITIEPQRISLAPSDSAEVKSTILNRQGHVDHFFLAIDGLPDDWATLPKADLMLAPGDSGTLTVRLHPPRHLSALAREHPFVVRVTSRADTEQYAESRGLLSIEAFHALDVNLQPSVYTDSGHGTVRLVNRGNVTERVDLSVTDPADAVDLRFAVSQIVLEPGQERSIEVTVHPSSRAPRGFYQSFPFTLRACVAEEALATVDGSLTLRASAVPDTPTSQPPSKPPLQKPEAAPAKPRLRPLPKPEPEPEPQKRRVTFWHVLFGLITTGFAGWVLWTLYDFVVRHNGMEFDTPFVAVWAVVGLIAGLRLLFGRGWKLAIFFLVTMVGWIAVRIIYG
jgi:hypothetical protein